MALTGALWVILFAGAWLLGHGSSASTPSGAVAVNSGLRTAAPRSSGGVAVPGLASVPGAPALAATASAPPRRVRHVTAHRTAPAVLASAPARPVVLTPAAPVRRSTTIVTSRPVVSHPNPPASVPTHTTSTPPPTHTSPPPSGGTGTVSGGG